MLNQVRFLDHIVDSGSLTKKVLEVLGVLPLGLQRDMISYLPEVRACVAASPVMVCYAGDLSCFNFVCLRSDATVALAQPPKRNLFFITSQRSWTLVAAGTYSRTFRTDSYS